VVLFQTVPTNVGGFRRLSFKLERATGRGSPPRQMSSSHADPTRMNSVAVDEAKLSAKCRKSGGVPDGVLPGDVHVRTTKEDVKWRVTSHARR
jgi:hypothetical protein